MLKQRIRSFLLRFSLLGSLLGFSSDGGSLFSDLDRSEQGLPAVAFNCPDRAVFDTSPQKDAGDGADDFIFFDESGGGDVLSEFGDAGDEAVVGGLIEEDSVVSFFFDFSLGPFLDRGRCTLAPAFFWEAALAMASLLFFWPCTGCLPIGEIK